MKKQIIFIVNPTAGPISYKKIPQIISDSIDKSIFDYKILYTESQGHAKIIVSEALENGVDGIVAVGGDGTVNEVGSKLINTNIPMGIIPTGSGNGLARELGIPINLKKATYVINQFSLKKIDNGFINKQAFFCTAGIGFDATIAKLFSLNQKRGFREYIRVVLNEFFNYKPLEYHITTESKSFSVDAFAITVANARQYGNNAFIAPEASINDQLLDLVILKPFLKRNAPEVAYQLFTGKLFRSPFYVCHKVKHVEIASIKADCFHSDGEHCIYDNKLTFEVNPLSLNVIVPRQAN